MLNTKITDFSISDVDSSLSDDSFQTGNRVVKQVLLHLYRVVWRAKHTYGPNIVLCVLQVPVLTRKYDKY